MKYKKIESEIDNLLRNPKGLNPYERRLLRKTKRYLCTLNEGVKRLCKIVKAGDAYEDGLRKRLDEEREGRLEYDRTIAKLKDKIWNQRPIWFLIGAVAFRVCELVVYYAGR